MQCTSCRDFPPEEFGLQIPDGYGRISVTNAHYAEERNWCLQFSNVPTAGRGHDPALQKRNVKHQFAFPVWYALKQSRRWCAGGKGEMKQWQQLGSKTRYFMKSILSPSAIPTATASATFPALRRSWTTSKAWGATPCGSTTGMTLPSRTRATMSGITRPSPPATAPWRMRRSCSGPPTARASMSFWIW